MRIELRLKSEIDAFNWTTVEALMDRPIFDITKEISLDGTLVAAHDGAFLTFGTEPLWSGTEEEWAAYKQANPGQWNG